MSRSSSFSVKSELSPKLDPESLKQWVVAFCVIRFDLEQGQLIEECYPPNCLTHEEELEIAFSSFPDSVSQNQNQNRSSIHDSMFFFRFRSSSVSFGLRYMYGFVFNRERHDERLKRGGEQKSVVILSRFPFSSVFKPLLQIMGPLYFDIGKKALEHIAGYVSIWPAPNPGCLMELPIGNATLKVNLPPHHSFPLESQPSFEESHPSMAPILPNNPSVPQGLFHDSDIFGIFRGIILQLWVLWELTLIGQPVLIIAPSPPQCCTAVSSLVSLIAPLLCSVDFRPYFTIHNPEFAKLNSLREGDSFPPMVLGVTNLFFLKSLRDFPHIVSVGSPNPNSNRNSSANRSSSIRLPNKPEGFGIPQLSLNKFSPSSLLNAVKLRREGPLCLMTEHKEAIWTSYAAITKPDTSILNRLIDAGMSPRIEESMSMVNNEILRRHFLELTTNFLAPFGPYFRTITPSGGSSPFLDPPPLLAFNTEEFLVTLSARGPGKFMSKRLKSNWLDLYRRFLKGPNFIPWFERRRSAAEQEQHRLWRQARMNADIQRFISKMPEIEIVDSFNAIERHIIRELQLEKSGKFRADSTVAYQKLKGDLRAVFNVLPKDMQELLLLNPEKAALLQGSVDHVKLPGRPLVQFGGVSSPR